VSKQFVLLLVSGFFFCFYGAAQPTSPVAPVSVNDRPFIVFAKHAKQVFGFDDYRFEEWQGEYPEWITEQADNYRAAYKSVGENETDLVEAHLLHGAAISPDSITFHIVDSDQRIRFTHRNDVFTLSLPAMAGSYIVSARYGDLELGRLRVVVYAVHAEKVIIVPLIPFTGNIDSLAFRVNKTYRQANMRIDLQLQPLFTHRDIDTTALFDNPSTEYDRYTPQMQKLRDLYFATYPNADRNAYYLFIVPGFTDPAIKGYMVRNKAMGFIVANKEARMAVSIARNLARGIGLLKDSWLDNGPEKRTTDNLMDRTGGTSLRRIQWEDLRHSSHSFSFYDNYENVRTNNGIVAYYFWKEDAEGNIVLEGSLLQSVKRPFKKNYFSYHLNIDNFLFTTLFTVRGTRVNTVHILSVLIVCGGIYYLGRLGTRYLRKRFKRPRFLRFGSRIVQLGLMIYLSYLVFLLVNLGYGWYEVRSGELSELTSFTTGKAIDFIAENTNEIHPSEDELSSELLIRRGNKWSLQKNRQVLYFELKEDANGNWTKAKLQHDGDSLILPALGFSEKAESHYLVFNYTDSSGAVKQQKVFNHLGIDITSKLRLADPAKRILLFVNGYRPTSVGHTFEDNFKDIRSRGLEFPDSKNLVYNFDRYDYWRPWQGMDLLFQKRINATETFYADGHFSVSTSNHRSLLNFTTISAIYPKRCRNQKKHICYVQNSVRVGFLGSTPAKTIRLHRTRPNKNGFWKRRMNGRVAGRNIYQMLNELPNKSGNDTLYIVAHSMGYAYALGIMDVLKGKVHFGELYILAPENASAGEVLLSDWMAVWQYGSNFNPKKYDAPCLLDGVAPQAKAAGLGDSNRIYIPRALYKKKGFFDSHFIGYYTWIFDIPEGKRGYVRQR